MVFSKAIYTGNSQKKFKLEEMASPHGEYSHFILIDKTIYFTLFSSSEKLYKLMSYDGKSFQEVERTPDPILAIPVNSVPYRCILSKGTTSLRSLIGEEVEKTFPESFFLYTCAPWAISTLLDQIMMGFFSIIIRS